MPDFESPATTELSLQADAAKQWQLQIDQNSIDSGPHQPRMP
jgi:hypothetical protein